MTDSEILKALVGCFGNDFNNTKCNECPFYTATTQCMVDLRNSVLDLINRQKAEIERINVYCENLEISQNHLLNEFATARKTAKSEAIKEFAEWVKSEIPIILNAKDGATMHIVLDTIVKEFAEGKQKNDFKE